MCCHPALPLAGRVALTLKTVTGLSTREIARAFLATEATMSKRLLRTKTKIEHAGIGFRMPPAHRLADRTDGVLAVVYLLFNEGYAATEGDRFGRTSRRRPSGWRGCSPRCCPTTTRSPDSTRCSCSSTPAGTRGPARGELLTLEEQDRGRWDRA